MSMVLADPRDGAVYAALDHGHFGAKLRRSADGGDVWEEVAVPSYPEPGPGEDVRPVTGERLPWKLGKVWALEPAGPDEPGVLWCGTIPGGLFRTADGGRSWSLVETLWRHPSRAYWFGGGADRPALHSICVDPRDPRRLALGVSCGGVWASDDGGESWECRATGMRAAYMPPEQQGEPTCRTRTGSSAAARPRTASGPSTTTASSGPPTPGVWREIAGDAPSTFGFAVAVHPRDPDVAWFVPGISDQKRIPPGGRLAVTRTRDGGRTFDVLTAGLPQRNAYDIAYRHALDVDGRGETLAFGSTTGSLWVSEDAGDSWKAAAEHLPPVYCVRFAGAA